MFRQVFLEHEAAEGLEHRHFDMLALSRAQAVYHGGHHRISGVQPGDLVGDQRWQVARALVAVCARQQGRGAAGGLDHVVIGLQPGIGPARAEADAMRIDDVWSERADAVVIEPEPLDRFGADIVDEDVGIGEQIAQYRAVGLLLEIEHQRLLAAIERDVSRPHRLAVRGGRTIAEHVAAGGLDLDHLGPEIGKDLRAIGPEYDRGHVDHAKPFEHRATVPGRDHSMSLSGTAVSASRSGSTSARAITSLRPCA